MNIALAQQYVGYVHPMLSGDVNRRWQNQITGECFTTQSEALVSISSTLTTLGADYGARLSDLQNLWRNHGTTH